MSEEGTIPPGIPLGHYLRRSSLNIERRFPDNMTNIAEEHPYPSTLPRPSHWSIAWSDLMMTMFILFLSMYIYQSAKQDFLGQPEPEIIGGDTTEALQSLDSDAAFPFAPISPSLPLITGGTIKKVETVEPATAPENAPTHPAARPEDAAEREEADLFAADQIQAPLQETIAVLIEPSAETSPPPLVADPLPSPGEEVSEPRPLLPEPPPTTGRESFREMFALGQGDLETEELEKIASIDVVPDKTMRIILTSDLLFALGQSTLSETARQSLLRVAAVIRDTPYMINIVGHTDNVPMRSQRFESNWELSVARASTVARYLIDEMGMNPNQFVVSGYSSYRPILPNTTAENRARNRRVEIIVSKRLPQPETATAENLR
ncbi:MAG: flagellar motor protein MotB [Desulforhopalus sp.]|nr:flagellar motor protein MotB [Desulforhopalus sp.]